MTNIEFNNLVYTASKSLKYPALKFTRNNTEDANDLIQDTMVKALNNKAKFQQGTNIKAWLYIIMKNTFISKYHSDKKQTLTDPIEEAHVFASEATTDYNKGTSNIALEEIYGAINKLDKIFKDPFMMHFSGYKYEEIAEKLNIPMGTVKNRIHVARQTLMTNLKDFKI